MRKKLVAKDNKPIAIKDKRIDALYLRVTSHIEHARSHIQKTVDTEMVKAYWQIGKEVVEEEQHGKERAEYGKSVLEKLAVKLKAKYVRGFGVDTLEQARRFYLTYQLPAVSKSDAVRRKSETPAFNPNLSWTHYRLLMKITRLEARVFYELEASKNHWSSRELDRQINSLLFDRLAKSKDKDGLLRLAQKGQEIVNPVDAIKEPIVLEFLDIPESHRLVESKLEEALINNLQNFLLELGKGFAFVARQKRLTLDGDHFYADLVFYHVILKCYVIIDIKTRKLTHSDLGQMLLYANYFDQEVKMEIDNPTIGLVLCTKKSNSMVKYLLGERAKQVFASTYKFHLPTEKELEIEIDKELKKLNDNQVKLTKKIQINNNTKINNIKKG